MENEKAILTCVYCGKPYPPETPEHGSHILTEHIRVCKEHPLRKAEERISLLRTALVGLVGAREENELKGMLHAMDTGMCGKISDIDYENTRLAIVTLIKTAEELEYCMHDYSSGLNNCSKCGKVLRPHKHG